jgi:hypothetical protein
MSWLVIPEYLRILPNIRIIILGSYRNGCMCRLKNVRNGLIESGFQNTRLAIDFKIPLQMQDELTPSYNLRKSEYWLLNSHIQIFIFFPKTDNANIGIELKTHLTYPGNAWSTIIASYDNPPSLVPGLGLRFQPELTMFNFSDDSDIISQSKGQIINLLSRLYNLPGINTLGEWEHYSSPM